jgi:hypothetical protein
MDTNNPVPKKSFRWLALLAGTVGIHLLVLVALSLMAVLKITFVDGQVVFLYAILCLPAAWSVLILWKFRSLAERVVGIIAAISSLLEISSMMAFWLTPWSPMHHQ